MHAFQEDREKHIEVGGVEGEREKLEDDIQKIEGCIHQFFVIETVLESFQKGLHIRLYQIRKESMTTTIRRK